MTFKKGYNMSEETKRKLFTPERNLKLSQSLKGRIFSAEHRKHISESNRGNVPWNKGLRDSEKLWKNGHPRGMLGKHHSEASARKISESNKGKSSPRGMLGKHLSEEAKYKIGIGHRGKKRPDLIERNKKNPMKLDRHPNWRGGKSFEKYTTEFNKELKEKIRKRDNLSCLECGFSEQKFHYKLTIHHIDYNKKNNNPDNLISLCKSCHSKTNYGREDWTEYFKISLGKDPGW